MSDRSPPTGMHLDSAPFGSWPSPLGAKELTQGIRSLAELQASDGVLYYLESRPEEGGRTTLIARVDDSVTELTPPPFNVRSRVHEYGGGSFLATPTHQYFINFDDQNIYEVESNDHIRTRQITHTSASQRYADFCLSNDATFLICVLETHPAADQSTPLDAQEPQNSLVKIDIATGKQRTLNEGHDFYAAPRINHAGKLAFIVWDHPNMPWDGSQLLCGTLTDGGLNEVVAICGGSNEAVLQPTWNEQGALFYISDRNGFGNLYRTDSAAGADEINQPNSLHVDSAEYGSPPWVFGQRDYCHANSKHLIAVRQNEGNNSLCAIDTTTGTRTDLCSRFAGYQSLVISGDAVLFIAERATAFPAIVRHDLRSGEQRIICEAAISPVDTAYLSSAEPIQFTNRNGQISYANYYPPCNPAVQLAPGEPNARPPLLVLSHGGPSAASSTALNLRIQYYTTRGWAVADVNYGGSTGFGREYRARLNNNWGLVDVIDCEDAAAHLAQQGLADPARLAIKGGSAGGYTTLAALTFGDRFAAGASHYGIGDLTALANETHKFEARYIDGLVPQAKWQERSPINHVETLSCPVIFFQGSDDAIVPPGQAQAMVAAIKAKGLPVAYVEFSGEGHGFRRAENIQFAAQAEYQFFCVAFGIDGPDPLLDLVIDNASPS